LDIYNLFSLVNYKGKIIDEWNFEVETRSKTSVELLESMHEASVLFSDNADKSEVDYGRSLTIYTAIVPVLLRTQD
jgi:hypothetical protein